MRFQEVLLCLHNLGLDLKMNPSVSPIESHNAERSCSNSLCYKALIMHIFNYNCRASWNNSGALRRIY